MLFLLSLFVSLVKTVDIPTACNTASYIGKSITLQEANTDYCYQVYIRNFYLFNGKDFSCTVYAIKQDDSEIFTTTLENPLGCKIPIEYFENSQIFIVFRSTTSNNLINFIYSNIEDSSDINYYIIGADTNNKVIQIPKSLDLGNDQYLLNVAVLVSYSGEFSITPYFGSKSSYTIMNIDDVEVDLQFQGSGKLIYSSYSLSELKIAFKPGTSFINGNYFLHKDKKWLFGTNELNAISTFDSPTGPSCDDANEITSETPQQFENICNKVNEETYFINQYNSLFIAYTKDGNAYKPTIWSRSTLVHLPADSYLILHGATFIRLPKGSKEVDNKYLIYQNMETSIQINEKDKSSIIYVVNNENQYMTLTLVKGNAEATTIPFSQSKGSNLEFDSDKTISISPSTVTILTLSNTDIAVSFTFTTINNDDKYFFSCTLPSNIGAFNTNELELLGQITNEGPLDEICKNPKQITESTEITLSEKTCFTSNSALLFETDDSRNPTLIATLYTKKPNSDTYTITGPLTNPPGVSFSSSSLNTEFVVLELSSYSGSTSKYILKVSETPDESTNIYFVNEYASYLIPKQGDKTIIYISTSPEYSYPVSVIPLEGDILTFERFDKESKEFNEIHIRNINSVKGFYRVTLVQGSARILISYSDLSKYYHIPLTTSLLQDGNSILYSNYEYDDSLIVYSNCIDNKGEFHAEDFTGKGLITIDLKDAYYKCYNVQSSTFILDNLDSNIRVYSLYEIAGSFDSHDIVGQNIYNILNSILVISRTSESTVSPINLISFPNPGNGQNAIYFTTSTIKNTVFPVHENKNTYVYFYSNEDSYSIQASATSYKYRVFTADSKGEVSQKQGTLQPISGTGQSLIEIEFEQDLGIQADLNPSSSQISLIKDFFVTEDVSLDLLELASLPTECTSAKSISTDFNIVQHSTVCYKLTSDYLFTTKTANLNFELYVKYQDNSYLYSQSSNAYGVSLNKYTEGYLIIKSNSDSDVQLSLLQIQNTDEQRYFAVKTNDNTNERVVFPANSVIYTFVDSSKIYFALRKAPSQLPKVEILNDNSKFDPITDFNRIYEYDYALFKISENNEENLGLGHLDTYSYMYYTCYYIPSQKPVVFGPDNSIQVEQSYDMTNELAPVACFDSNGYINDLITSTMNVKSKGIICKKAKSSSITVFDKEYYSSFFYNNYLRSFQNYVAFSNIESSKETYFIGVNQEDEEITIKTLTFNIDPSIESFLCISQSQSAPTSLNANNVAYILTGEDFTFSWGNNDQNLKIEKAQILNGAVSSQFEEVTNTLPGCYKGSTPELLKVTNNGNKDCSIYLKSNRVTYGEFGYEITNNQQFTQNYNVYSYTTMLPSNCEDFSTLQSNSFSFTLNSKTQSKCYSAGGNYIYILPKYDILVKLYSSSSYSNPLSIEQSPFAIKLNGVGAIEFITLNANTEQTIQLYETPYIYSSIESLTIKSTSSPANYQTPLRGGPYKGNIYIFGSSESDKTVTFPTGATVYSQAIDNPSTPTSVSFTEASPYTLTPNTIYYITLLQDTSITFPQITVTNTKFEGISRTNDQLRYLMCDSNSEEINEYSLISLPSECTTDKEFPTSSDKQTLTNAQKYCYYISAEKAKVAGYISQSSGSSLSVSLLTKDEGEEQYKSVINEDFGYFVATEGYVLIEAKAQSTYTIVNLNDASYLQTTKTLSNKYIAPSVGTKTYFIFDQAAVIHGHPNYQGEYTVYQGSNTNTNTATINVNQNELVIIEVKAGMPVFEVAQTNTASNGYSVILPIFDEMNAGFYDFSTLGNIITVNNYLIDACLNSKDLPFHLTSQNTGDSYCYNLPSNDFFFSKKVSGITLHNTLAEKLTEQTYYYYKNDLIYNFIIIPKQESDLYVFNTPKTIDALITRNTNKYLSIKDGINAIGFLSTGSYTLSIDPPGQFSIYVYPYTDKEGVSVSGNLINGNECSGETGALIIIMIEERSVTIDYDGQRSSIVPELFSIISNSDFTADNDKLEETEENENDPDYFPGVEGYDPSYQKQDDPIEPDDDGLSGGAIAGIVIAVVVVVAAACGAIFYFMFYRPKHLQHADAEVQEDAEKQEDEHVDSSPQP